jgi:hypothetical protein
MIVIVTRTEKITTEVELTHAEAEMYSAKELKEVAIDQAKFQFANNKTIDYSGDGETYKIREYKGG